MFEDPIGEAHLVADDIDLDRRSAKEMYQRTFDRGPLGLRRARIQEDVVFQDIVEEIHGPARANEFISCPFHGRDRKPSFKLFKRSNDAFCFGCPEGQKYYDSVLFVAAKFGYTQGQAIAWIEKKYAMPPIEDDDPPEVDGEVEVVSLNFTHLAAPYIRLASSRFLESGANPEVARSYIALFFEGAPDRKADPALDEQIARALPMARALGGKELDRLKKGLR